MLCEINKIKEKIIKLEKIYGDGDSDDVIKSKKECKMQKFKNKK